MAPVLKTGVVMSHQEFESLHFRHLPSLTGGYCMDTVFQSQNSSAGRAVAL